MDINDGRGNKRVKFHKVLSIIVVAAAIAVTIAAFILMLFNLPGMDIVFFIALLLSCIIIAHLLLRKLRTREKYAKLALALHRCLFICVAIGVVGFLVLQCLIFSGSRTEDADADCLIILGAGLYGEYPSRILVSRLETAIEYLGARDGVPIIVSGGQGPGETITEAEAMSRYLIRRGVDENQIHKEENSTSTWENLAFSLDLLTTMGLDGENPTIAIVTNDFHLYRAKHIAGTLGIDAIGVSARTPYPSLRVLYQFREAVALMKDFLSIGNSRA